MTSLVLKCVLVIGVVVALINLSDRFVEVEPETYEAVLDAHPLLAIDLWRTARADGRYTKHEFKALLRKIRVPHDHDKACAPAVQAREAMYQQAALEETE